MSLSNFCKKLKSKIVTR